MKVKIRWLLAGSVALLLLSIAAAGCSIEPSTIQVGFKTQQEGIWVTGEGKISAVPDLATLRLGISAQASTVAEAQARATEAMNKVMNAMTNGGVAKKDIQTQYFSIQKVTKWDKDKNQEIVIGYQVTNTVTAKIRSLPQESFPLDYKAGRIIDAVVQAGGDLTRIDSISFSIADPSAYQQEARDKAMSNARAKAEQIAKLAGVTLGKPTYISESVSVPPPIYPVKAAEAGPAMPTPISPGEVEVTLNVQVAYAIK